MAKPSASSYAAFGKLGTKALSIGIKMIKVLKVGKVALAAGSLAAYALMFTWQFAVVIIGSLFIHEYAHVWAMKRLGMRVKGMYFIPFLGAAAVPEGNFPDRRTEWITAYAGPLAGLGMALVGLATYYVTHNAYVAAVTGWIAFLNLFNLLPVSPLDGGRILKTAALSIGTKVGLGFMTLAIFVLAYLTFTQRLYIFMILLPLAVIEFALEWATAKKSRETEARMAAILGDAYKPPVIPVRDPLPRRQIPVVIGAYAGLACLLFLCMFVLTHEPGAAAAMTALQG